jgi:hypothetical protein
MAAKIPEIFVDELEQSLMFVNPAKADRLLHGAGVLLLA